MEKLAGEELVRSLLALASAASSSLATAVRWTEVLASGKSVVRYLSMHSGVPALLVASLLVCVGYRVLKRTMKFVIEVAAVALALVVALEVGWLSW